MTQGEKLLWDMKVTAGARFNASHRLASKDRFSNLALALFSAVLLSISVITVAFALDPSVAKGLAVASIMASVMALIFSMKIYADQHAVEAEQMHRCALEINEIRRKFAALDMSDPKMLTKATDEYNFVLQKYSLNHSDRDFKKYKYEHRWEFTDLKDHPNYEEKIVNATRSLLENPFERFSVAAAVAALAAAVSFLSSLFSI